MVTASVGGARSARCTGTLHHERDDLVVALDGRGLLGTPGCAIREEPVVERSGVVRKAIALAVAAETYMLVRH